MPTGRRSLLRRDLDYSEFTGNCRRDGSRAGVAVKLGSSTKKPTILLEADGRCSNAEERLLKLGSAQLLVLGLGTRVSRYHPSV